MSGPTECIMGVIPTGYQEVSCSNKVENDGIKSFTCAPGYKMSPPTDILQILNNGASPSCDFAKISPRCINTTFNSNKINQDTMNCNECALYDKKDTCPTDNCYWNQNKGIGETSNEGCKNKCSARKTMGECEQFYDHNETKMSDTIYNYDGTDHKCKWYPSYLNVDITDSSTDGTCRPTSAPCLSDENKDAYCKYNYISRYEETCIKNIDQNSCNNNTSKCVWSGKEENPFKCVSDGKIFTNSKYKGDEYCNKLEYEPCVKQKGCIAVPERAYCKSKDINDLINLSSIDEPLCIPLKAQIPQNYDINLLENENISIDAFTQEYNREQPYYTSRYLCDICHIRNEDIKKMDEGDDPLYNLNNPGGNELNKKSYCLKSIDSDKVNGRRPCEWSDDGQCVSRCKNIIKKAEPPPPTCNGPDPCPTLYHNIEYLKNVCLNQTQYSSESTNEIEFPNLVNGEENDTDYYKELYCAWDGFECNNSIPCKDTQRIRCEDLGYEWYEGTNDDVVRQKQDNRRQLNTDDADDDDNFDEGRLGIYPQKRKGDGKPIKGDSAGICIFPNDIAKYKGDPSKYEISIEYLGDHSIIVKWYEYGSGWWNDVSLYKREMSNREPNDSTTTTKKASVKSIIDNTSNDKFFLGENIALIPYKLVSVEHGKPSDIMQLINDHIASYRYYVLNGKQLIWAEEIYKWVLEKGEQFLKYNYDYVADSGNINIGWNYYKGKTTYDDLRKKPENDNNKERDMCHVIHDLRGIINLIPVVDGIAKIRIQDFRIDGDTGKVFFEMEPDKLGHFVFNGFVGLDDIDGTDPMEITILNKYNWEKSISTNEQDEQNENNHWGLPGSIGEGYGFLYDYIRKGLDIEVIKGDTGSSLYDELIKISKSNKDDYYGKLLQTMKSYLKGEDNDNDNDNDNDTESTSRNTYALYKELEDHKNFEPDGIHPDSKIQRLKERLEILRKPMINDNGERYPTTGSLESHKIYNINKPTNNVPVPKYQTISIDETPFLQLMQSQFPQYKQDKTDEYSLQRRVDKQIFDNLITQLLTGGLKFSDIFSANIQRISHSNVPWSNEYTWDNATLTSKGDSLFLRDNDSTSYAIKIKGKWTVSKAVNEGGITWTLTTLPDTDGNYGDILQSADLKETATGYANQDTDKTNRADTIILTQSNDSVKTYNKKDEITKDLDTNNRDIRHAALWGMTRPYKDAYYGDLLYKDKDKIKADGGDENINKHMLDPYKSENSDSTRIIKNQLYIDLKNLLLYSGGNYNRIIRHKDYKNPIPSWFETEQKWLTKDVLKNNNDKSNTYFKYTYIDYLNLTPNNGLYESEKKWNSVFLNVPPGEDIPEDVTDYYSPGKWLDPLVIDDKYAWPTLSRLTQPFAVTNETFVSETHTELKKLNRLCYNWPTPPSPTQPWPQTPKEIDTLTETWLTYLENQGSSAGCRRVNQNWDLADIYFADQRPDDQWRCSKWGGTFMEGGRVCTGACPNSVTDMAYHYPIPGSNPPQYQWRRYYGAGGNSAVRNQVMETGPAVSALSEDVSVWVKNNQPKINTWKTLLEPDITTKEMTEFASNRLYPFLNEAYKYTEEDLNKLTTWITTGNYGSRGKSQHGRKKPLTMPIGFGLDSWRKNAMPSGLALPADFTNRPTVSGDKWSQFIENPYVDTPKDLINGKISINPHTIKNISGKAQINTLASPSYIYPNWINYGVNGNMDLYCRNLLAYVPNKGGDNTIKSISLDNCSLPILTNPLKDTDNEFNHLTNNLKLFTEKNSDPTPLTIRDVCPKLCQSYACSNIPTISDTFLNVENKLFIIMTKEANRSTKNILNEYYTNFVKKNYNGIPIKNLFTIAQFIPIDNTLHTLNNISADTSLHDPKKPSPQNLLNTRTIVDTNIPNVECKNHILARLDSTHCKGQLGATPSCRNCLTDDMKDCDQYYDTVCVEAVNASNRSKKNDDNSVWKLHNKHFMRNKKGKYTDTPYLDPGNDCNIPTYNGNVKFTRIDKVENIEFFKPTKIGGNHLFKSSKSNEQVNLEKEYGCIRDDIMTVDKNYYKLNCNTNTSYPIERSKYVMINYIIEHSDNTLNISDRTKLVLMNEEELINKAGQLNIDIDKLNEYTRPKLISNVNDIYNDTSNEFEYWNDLEQTYLNISQNNNESKNYPKLGVNKWDYIGCSLDFNNSDNSKIFESCLDKYPGLCNKYSKKCDDRNIDIRNAFRNDCPETCRVQLDDMKQVGNLSICTGSGRCRWERDLDKSNLLPVCKEIASRDYGDSDTCNNYLNIYLEECEGDMKDSKLCKQKKCESLIGCEFTPGSSGVCIQTNAYHPEMSQDKCDRNKGTWNQNTKSCLIAEFANPDITETNCRNNNNYRWESTIEDRCIFNSNSWTPLEDPCGFPMIDIGSCSTMDKDACDKSRSCDYINGICVSKDITQLDEEDLKSVENKNWTLLHDSDKTIKSIKPACKSNNEQCKKHLEIPDSLELTIDSDDNIVEVDDWLKIGKSDLNDQCIELLNGYSKVISKVGNKIYITGPKEAYTLNYKTGKGEENDYSIGSCKIEKVYRFDANDKDKEQCQANDKASCTYVQPRDDSESGYCKSCSLIKNRGECIDNNKTSTCGWGEVEDVCNTIGDIRECNDMYIEGCEWDMDKEMCILNSMTDRDGNTLKKSEGCMKCANLKHKNTCTSLSNCYWDSQYNETHKGSCHACSEQTDKGNCESTTITGKSCEWSKDLDICVSANLYPLIYEWIWYNKLYLLSLIGCLILIWFIPSSFAFPMNIGVWIIKIILIFVVIPGLMVYPGIQRADGEDGRKYYKDPHMDPSKPGWTDFLHDSNEKGAIWPARIYDGKWDDIIMGDDTLRSMIDLKIGPGILDWTSLFWGLLRDWNKLVNSLGENDIYLILIILILIIIIILGISSYIKSPHPIITCGLVFTVIIGIFIIRDTDTQYETRELVNPYPTSHMFHDLYNLPTVQVCPYGCIDNNTQEPCKDTRSNFAFGGNILSILDPDPYLDENPSITYTDGNYTCPKHKEHTRWPYSRFCKDRNNPNTCVAKNKEFNTVSENTKKLADEKCQEYFNTHNQCNAYNMKPTPPPFQSELVLEIDDPNHTKYKLHCDYEAITDDDCPFEENVELLSYKDEFKQRHPINIWENIYNTIAGPSKERVPHGKTMEWQNQLRYEIIGQNYAQGAYKDKYTL